MSVRLALNEEGERIGELIGLDLDWSEVYPYWLVYEKDNRILGCLNVALSKPIGILDQLKIDPDVGPHTRGRIVRALILQGIATLKADDTHVCVSMIPFELKAYKKLLKKHFGAEVIGQGNIVMTRL